MLRALPQGAEETQLGDVPLPPPRITGFSVGATVAVGVGGLLVGVFVGWAIRGTVEEEEEDEDD